MKITKTTIENNLMFVVKYYEAYRETMSFKDTFNVDMDEVRDLDLLCFEGQPEVVKEFLDGLYYHEKVVGHFVTVPEYMHHLGLIPSIDYYSKKKEAKAKKPYVDKPLVNSQLAKALQAL